MNIAIIQQSPDIGGAETYMYDLVSELLKGGNNVYLFTNKGKFYTLMKTLPVEITHMPKILDISGNLRGLVKSIVYLPFLFFMYYRVIRMYKKKADVLLLTGFSEKLLSTFVTLFLRVPVVWIEYGPLKTIFKRNFGIPFFLYSLLKNIPRKIIVPSKSTLHSLINDAHVAKAKLVLIPCGTRIKRVKAEKDKKFKK